jgi:hypothetical protein
MSFFDMIAAQTISDLFFQLGGHEIRRTRADCGREQALSIARPACAAVKDGPMRKPLDDRKLCET